MEIALGVPAVLAAAVDVGGPTSAAALGGGALKAALGSSDGAVKLVLGQDGGGALTPAVLLLHGRSRWSACLLGHALSMRRCAPPPPPPPSHSPPLLSDTAVLHALLRPHGGVDDHPPRAECKPTPPPVCSARTQHVRDTKAPLPSHADTNQDGRREVQFGAPLPSDDELLRTARAAGELYAANTSVVGARAVGRARRRVARRRLCGAVRWVHHRRRRRAEGRPPALRCCLRPLRKSQPEEGRRRRGAAAADAPGGASDGAGDVRTARRPEARLAVHGPRAREGGLPRELPRPRRRLLLPLHVQRRERQVRDRAAAGAEVPGAAGGEAEEGEIGVDFFRACAERARQGGL